MAESNFDRAGLVRRGVRMLVTRRPVAALSARVLPGTDRRVWRATGGRVTVSAWLTGLPVVEMETVGARSGRPRRVRVLAVPEGNSLIVVAANFGQRADPAWCHNVRSNAYVVVHTGTWTGSFEARELGGAERDAGFARALQLNPGWVRFRDRAGGRVIPVFRLERTAGPSRCGVGPVPEHLRESMVLLQVAYPNGVPAEDYLPLLVAVHETFSDRNLATVVAASTGLDYSRVDNDHAAAVSIRQPSPVDVARVRARLDAVGWVDDD